MKEDEKEYFTLDEAAEFVGISRTTLMNTINILKISTYRFRLDKRTFLTRESVMSIKETREKPWLAGPVEQDDEDERQISQKRGSKKERKTSMFEKTDSSTTSTPKFWVYANLPTNTCTIHFEFCRYCNDGEGVKESKILEENRWYGPFNTLQEALQKAADTGLRNIDKCRASGVDGCGKYWQ